MVYLRSNLTECPRLGLVTKAIDNLWGGADECETGLLDLARKFGVFGQESITRTQSGREENLWVNILTLDGSCRHRAPARFL